MIFKFCQKENVKSCETIGQKSPDMDVRRRESKQGCLPRAKSYRMLLQNHIIEQVSSGKEHSINNRLFIRPPSGGHTFRSSEPVSAKPNRRICPQPPPARRRGGWEYEGRGGRGATHSLITLFDPLRVTTRLWAEAQTHVPQTYTQA